MIASYDTWSRATTQEHFNSLLLDEHRLEVNTTRQLCMRGLRLCKQLPYSPLTWIFLMLLGSVSAVYGLLFDGLVGTLFAGRRYLIEAVGADSLPGFVVWTLWCVAACMLSTCCGYFISTAADGSGIPIMRALFAGVYQNPGDMLSFRTLGAKSLATVAAFGSGLSVGRAGPFTHIISIVAYLLGDLSLFRRVHFGPPNFTFLRAAVACGITASFGSPLGGVLFSIEVTAKYYEIKCLWEGVICSSFCVLIFSVNTFIKRQELFERTAFTGFSVNWDIFAFVLLGVITGIVAAVFCKLAILLRWTQNKLLVYIGLKKPSFRRRTFHVVSICVFTALITYPFSIMRISDREIVNEVFHDTPLSLPQWTQLSNTPQLTLLAYIGLKFVTSLLPCGAPLSCGVFVPLFTIGAAIGRLYGETLTRYWGSTQSPATYAVVGAACFASSATRTVSTAVIFFELTGQLSHMVPVMLACIVAYFVSGAITPSIYDILAGWAGLHSVCYDVNERTHSQKRAGDFMTDVNVFFTLETTYDEAIKALNTFKKEEYFPLCEDATSQMLVGCIRRFDLEVGIARFIAVHRSEISRRKSLPLSRKIEGLVSQILDTKKSAVVENGSLFDFQHKHVSSASNPLKLGPPFNNFVFTSIPVETYPPQVGVNVNLYRVHRVASIALWTQVYVVKQGKLIGVINLDSSLTRLRVDEVS